MNVPQPVRKIDAEWSVSQNEKEKSLFELEGFQMPPYPWQYVQNEVQLPIASWSSLKRHVNLFKTKIVPVAPQSLTGTIYHNNVAIHTFVVLENGVEINTIKEPKIFVEKINVINITGHLELYWNEYPGHHHIVVSYEYEYSNSVEYH